MAGCVAGIIIPAGSGWDFANFYDTGRRVAAGQIADVYDRDSLIGGQAPQGMMAFWGTPISALLYLPLSGLSPETALIVFKIQNVLAFFATFLVLFELCEPVAPDSELARARFAAVFAFLCLIYQPFWTVFRVGGQTTPTVLLLLTLALAFHTSARHWGTALCLVLAILIKPAMAPVLAFLLCVSGLAFLWRTVLVLGAAGLMSLALLGWPIHLAFMNKVSGAAQGIHPWFSNSSLFILVGNLQMALGPRAETGTYPMLLTGLTYAIRVTILVTFIYLMVRSRSQTWTDMARRHFHFIMALLFFLLWSPTLWEHYLALLFVPLVYVVAAHQYFSRRAVVLVALAFAMSIGQNLIVINFLRDHFAFNSWPALLGVALVKSSPLWLTLILLWRHYPELFRSYEAPVWRQPTLLVRPAPGS